MWRMGAIHVVADDRSIAESLTLALCAGGATSPTGAGIEQLITTDVALQELLKTQHLTMNSISATRLSTRQGAGDCRGNGPSLSNQQKDLHL
jgi:hypothetical protein